MAKSIKNHGKDLSSNDFTDQYKAKLDTIQEIYKYKGSVSTYSALAEIDKNETGDVYNVIENSKNYSWNGKSWNELGVAVNLDDLVKKTDLKQYATNEELNKKVSQTTFDTFQDNIEKTITAIKIEILKEENPVGHIRFETTNVNPATYLGFGTWVLWGSGRVPIGVDASDSDFSTVEKTGGSKTADISHAHTIKSHDHGGNTGSTVLTVNQIPSHSHDLGIKVTTNNGDSSAEVDQIAVNWSNAKHFSEYYGGKTGGGKGHTHTISASGQQTTSSAGSTSLSLLQPYITCYMWKRTA